MSQKRSIGLLAYALSLVLNIAACSSNQDDDSDSEAGEEQVAADAFDTIDVLEGGTVVLAGQQEPTGLNWTHVEDNAAWTATIMQHVWPATQMQLPDGSFVPREDFATYELTSQDPQTVEYTIDEDAVWSDGTPITADDFIFTWEAQSQCAEAAAAADPVSVYNAASCDGYELIQSVEGSGENNKTVTVTFAEPYADWVTLFGPVLPHHGFTAAGNGDPVAGFNTGFKIANLPSGDDLADYVLSGAQFIVTDYRPGVSMTLDRNPAYWGENAANIDTLLVRWITDGTRNVAVLQSGEVDVIFPKADLDLVEEVRAIPTATTSIGFGTSSESIQFNQENPHLADPAVRSALGLAIDRAEIVQRVPAQFDPAAQMLNNRMFLPGDPCYVDNSGQYAEQDVEAAQSALEGAGYTLGADGIYTHLERGRLSLRIMWREPNDREQSTARLVQEQTKQAGIDVAFAPQPDYEFLAAGSFDVALVGLWTGSKLAASAPVYITDGSQNYTGNSNPTVDTLFRQANAELDVETHADLMNQIDELIWQDLATIPLFQTPELLANDQQIGNVIYNGYGNGFSWNLAQWGTVAN